VTDSTHPVNIGGFERQSPYNETGFYFFDDFLVAQLEQEVQHVDVDEINR
jgi:hypothetical protein